MTDVAMAFTDVRKIDVHFLIEKDLKETLTQPCHLSTNYKYKTIRAQSVVNQCVIIFFNCGLQFIYGTPMPPVLDSG